MNPNDMTLHDLIPLLRSRELTPTALLDSCLARIEEKNGTLNAIVTPMYDTAKARAASLDGASPSGPLWGIPVAYKDIIETKGVRTTSGSPLLMDNIPTEDAVAVQQLGAADAVAVGKANTHEWAFGPSNEHSVFGACRNPWNPNKITGGSSGGSACAVASGMVIAALGSDTGGSIRMPAALCGVVGFKPTMGVISTKGVIPTARSLDHLGPLTRSVRDAAYVTDAASGGDGSSGRVSLAPGLDGFTSLKGMTIGVPTDSYFDDTDPEIAAAVQRGIRALEALGAKLVDIRLPMSDDYKATMNVIIASEAAQFHRERMAQHADRFTDGVRQRLTNGARYTAVEYVEAALMREEMARRYEEAMRSVEVFTCPALPGRAYDIGHDVIVENGVEREQSIRFSDYTRVADLLRVPSLSVPCGFLGDGMPVGLMLTGRYADDVTVLRIGHAYEQSVGGFRFPV